MSRFGVFELSAERKKDQKTFFVEITEEFLNALQELRFREHAYIVGSIRWGKPYPIPSIADTLDTFLCDPLFDYLDSLRSSYLEHFTAKFPLMPKMVELAV